jgi:hypothetical protein
MSNKISDLKRSLERHVGGESGEHQPTRVVKPDSKFSRLLVLSFGLLYGKNTIQRHAVSQVA